MLKQNFVLEKLRAGKPVLGTWCVIPSIHALDVICSAGLDFVIIDAEHGPISFETAQAMCMACESRAVSPLMRVGGVNAGDILRALDIGVHGVQVPNIESAEQVRQVVKHSKFPPLGERGFSPFVRSGGYALENAQSITETANKNTLLAVNIEGPAAIEELDAILDCQALDVVFVGLFDLSKALGIPGQVSHSRVKKLLRETCDKILRAGKWPGTIATSPQALDEYLDMGIRYLPYLVDCEMLRSAYRQISRHFEAVVPGAKAK